MRKKRLVVLNGARRYRYGVGPAVFMDCFMMILVVFVRFKYKRRITTAAVSIARFSQAPQHLTPMPPPTIDVEK